MSEENLPKNPATNKNALTRAANGNRQARPAPAGVRKTQGAKSSKPTKAVASGAKNDDNSQNAKKDPIVVIKKFSPVYIMKYQNSEYECYICRYPLTDVCYDCNIKGYTDCPSAKGVCNHQFHAHCIGNYLKKHNTCPAQGCGTRWQYA